jgi:hypothetical protein
MRDCCDTSWTVDCELCYECINCENCYNTKFSQDSSDCRDSSFMYASRNCSNCVGCVNLVNKKFHIFNQAYEKEEYLETMNQEHRRIIEKEYKIIYFIESEVIYVTDFFYTHRNPDNMKG